jgi:hypothetical protein
MTKRTGSAERTASAHPAAYSPAPAPAPAPAAAPAEPIDLTGPIGFEWMADETDWAAGDDWLAEPEPQPPSQPHPQPQPQMQIRPQPLPYQRAEAPTGTALANGPDRPPIIKQSRRTPSSNPARESGVRHGRASRGSWRMTAQHARDLAADPDQPRILDLSTEVAHDSLYNPRPYDRLPLDRASLDRLAHNRLMYDNGTYDDLLFPDPANTVDSANSVDRFAEPTGSGSGWGSPANRNAEPEADSERGRKSFRRR